MPNDPGRHPRYQGYRINGRQGSLHFTADRPLRGDRKRIPRPAFGSSVPDQSMGASWTNNEVQVRCEAGTNREQYRSSSPDDRWGPRRKEETRRTVDFGHSQTAQHRSTSPRSASTQRNPASRPVSTDFYNNRPIGDVGKCRKLVHPATKSAFHVREVAYPSANSANFLILAYPATQRLAARASTSWSHSRRVKFSSCISAT